MFTADVARNLDVLDVMEPAGRDLTVLVAVSTAFAVR
jgi:hypothetical protein